MDGKASADSNCMEIESKTAVTESIGRRTNESFSMKIGRKSFNESLFEATSNILFFDDQIFVVSRLKIE